MANEIIKLFEYVINNPAVKGVAILYIIFSVVVLVVVIAIFAVLLRHFFKMWRDFDDDFPRGRRRRK